MFLSLFEASPAAAVALILGFVVGITVHEAAHAYSAYMLGDDTAYREGRVTLNPASHLDVLGSLMLLMAGFGWGRPTPVVISNLRGGFLGPVAVAFAGPLSNLLIVALCGVLYLLPPLQTGFPVIVIAPVAFVNALLFVFNLIPIPPLDGAKVLYPFLPTFLDGFVDFMNQYGPMILFGVIILSFVIPGFSPFGFIIQIIRPILIFFRIPLLF